MQPETHSPATAIPSTPVEETSPRTFPRPRTWLFLAVLWTVLPYILVPLLDMAWGHPVKFPRLPPHLMVQWWVWIPLTPLIVALGRRFPLREPGALKHAAIHLLASWLVAIVLTLGLAAMAALVPIGWSPALVLNQALYLFGGFGAVFQILYWSVLGASFGYDWLQRRRRPAPRWAEAH